MQIVMEIRRFSDKKLPTDKKENQSNDWLSEMRC